MVFCYTCILSSLNWEYIVGGFLSRCDLFSVLVELDTDMSFVPNFLLPVAVACVLILFSLYSNPDMMHIGVAFISNVKQCKADGS